MVLENLNSGKLNFINKRFDVVRSVHLINIINQHFAIGDTPFTATDVSIFINKKHEGLNSSHKKVSKHLTSLFGESQLKRINGRVGKYYFLDLVK